MSRNIIVLFIALVFVRSDGFSQEYTFDKKVTGTFSTKVLPDKTLTNYFSTADVSYHLQVYSHLDRIIARIFDTNNNQLHYFYSKPDEPTNFKFVETIKLENPYDNFHVKFDDNKKTESVVILKVYNEKNKKVANYSLKIEECDYNGFIFFKYMATEILLFTQTTPPSNFIVLEAEGRNSNGKSVKYKLKSIENVQIILTVPQS
ncbi:hypothetical protein [Psychroserpens sp.]|uniref:hypothetical protein n=1 Tax=Psychroserpens sp. TaxID=2020870 RepID=UPI001B275EA6|nr:hypothetical protein [Psychroserpens sp.]MBO6606663.1 hypothetical protein [Psychroserpens sp.]MBO6631993.1 hypothetical protein [Psychroserpens sp.]MBO6653367.1 hypothetical protein [Psychroserpens sp.]MBO6680606.1 hypothetical protein [Psychroserpens sp.]MBO6750436.1 hypothetical protein [Psychroserpens sp.]